MTATAIENPALRRMLRPSTPATTGARMSEAKAWRSSLPRVSETQISMVASVVGYDVGKTDLEAILAGWDGYALSLLIKGPDEARGLVQFDDALRTGLIEAQTIGRVLTTQLVGRPGTPLDASLCDHVAKGWMDGAAEAQEKTNPWTPKRIIKDIRMAQVALDDGEYTTTEVTVLLGDGARTGVLRIVQPKAALAAQEGRADGGRGGRKNLLALEAEVVAVLHHARVPLAWLRDLKPGDVLEIPRRAIDNVQIQTLEGRRITRARLGQKEGRRAVRILDEDEPDTPFSKGGAAAFGGLAGGELPALGALPDLPDLPEPGPLGNLPDLSGDLPDFPGLPDLPDLPPLDD